MQYFLSYGLKLLRTRMFTHTGPRRGDVFAESAFAKQVAEIEAGVRTNPVKVGNLNSVRTLADVRDAVHAYWLLLEKCTPGEVYNIGGSETMTVGRVLEIFKGMAKCRIEHEVDPSLLRPSDVTLQIPDISKFRAESGWAPQNPGRDHPARPPRLSTEPHPCASLARSPQGASMAQSFAANGIVRLPWVQEHRGSPRCGDRAQAPARAGAPRGV